MKKASNYSVPFLSFPLVRHGGFAEENRESFSEKTPDKPA
jgi:hypothetical protein